MTIDEAIEVYKHPTQHFSGEHIEADKIAIQCMKKLKSLRAETKMFQLGYNKAIDDFTKELCKTFDETTLNDDGYYPNNVVRSIAEQLKAGARNGTDNQ